MSGVAVRLEAALLTPGRQTPSGVWSQRRLPPQPSGLLGLLTVGALLFCLARAGGAPISSAVHHRFPWTGAGGPRGPPLLLQLA